MSRHVYGKSKSKGLGLKAWAKQHESSGIPAAKIEELIRVVMSTQGHSAGKAKRIFGTSLKRVQEMEKAKRGRR
jgi:hypothetical protein